MMFLAIFGSMTLLAVIFVVYPLLKNAMPCKWMLVAIILTVLPMTSLFIYQKIGAVDLLTLNSMPAHTIQIGHSLPRPEAINLSQLANKLAEKLKANPNNADGWALLARTYCETNRYEEALPAFERAIKMSPKDATLLADYADILTLMNGGQFDARSEELIDRALRINPRYSKALMLKATIEFNRKNYQLAINCWKRLLDSPNLNPNVASDTKANIKEAQRLKNS